MRHRPELVSSSGTIGHAPLDVSSDPLTQPTSGEKPAFMRSRSIHGARCATSFSFARYTQRPATPSPIFPLARGLCRISLPPLAAWQLGQPRRANLDVAAGDVTSVKVHTRIRLAERPSVQSRLPRAVMRRSGQSRRVVSGSSEGSGAHVRECLFRPTPVELSLFVMLAPVLMLIRSQTTTWPFSKCV